MRALLRLFRPQRRPVQPPALPLEAALIFARAVRIAEQPTITESDVREIARCLQNLQVVLHAQHVAPVCTSPSDLVQLIWLLTR